MQMQEFSRAENVPDYFACNVFNEETMRDMLPKNVYKALVRTKNMGIALDPDVADVIAQHHECDGDVLNEASVLYLADKYIRDTRRVTLEDRFSASGVKCETEEAKAAHARRYQAAINIEKLIVRS